MRLGQKQSLESRAKMSASMKGLRRSPQTEFKKGQHFSPATEFKVGQVPPNFKPCHRLAHSKLGGQNF